MLSAFCNVRIWQIERGLLRFFLGPAFGADFVHQILLIKIHLIHTKLNCFNRIREIKGIMALFILLDQNTKDLELITFLCARLG